jgi:hypothetical protein
MTSIASWKAETIFAPAGDSSLEREGRGPAGRFPLPPVFLSTSLPIDSPLFLVPVTRPPAAELRLEFLSVCPDDRRDRMTIHRGQIILLVLAKDNGQGDRPELREMDVANAVRPTLSSGRFPPGKPELSQPS